MCSLHPAVALLGGQLVGEVDLPFLLFYIHNDTGRATRGAGRLTFFFTILRSFTGRETRGGGQLTFFIFLHFLMILGGQLVGEQDSLFYFFYILSDHLILRTLY